MPYVGAHLGPRIPPGLCGQPPGLRPHVHGLLRPDRCPPQRRPGPSPNRQKLGLLPARGRCPGDVGCVRVLWRDQRVSDRGGGGLPLVRLWHPPRLRVGPRGCHDHRLRRYLGGVPRGLGELGEPALPGPGLRRNHGNLLGHGQAAGGVPPGEHGQGPDGIGQQCGHTSADDLLVEVRAVHHRPLPDPGGNVSGLPPELGDAHPRPPLGDGCRDRHSGSWPRGADPQRLPGQRGCTWCPGSLDLSGGSVRGAGVGSLRCDERDPGGY